MVKTLSNSKYHIYDTQQYVKQWIETVINNLSYSVINMTIVTIANLKIHNKSISPTSCKLNYCKNATVD